MDRHHRYFRCKFSIRGVLRAEEMISMTTTFSRTSPSPRYRDLLTQYRDMHVHGEQFQRLPPQETFAGQSLPRHGQAIKALIDRFQARSLLDYGSGKGLQYHPMPISLPDGRQFSSIPEYWGVEAITCYDPGYEPYNKLPSCKFDGVICTDVLEHCPESDVPWIVEELLSFATRFVYANVACYPAKKRLANGENAHCTIKDAAWWREVLTTASRRHPAVRYFFQLERLVTRTDGHAEVATTSLQG